MKEQLLSASAFTQTFAIVRDDRKSTLDRLKAGKQLIRTMSEIKELYRKEIPDTMTSLLEKSIKSSRISFETALSYFMVVLGAISEDPHQVGTKSTDNIYRVFYQLLYLPMDTKNRRQLVQDDYYHELYEALRIDRNEQLELRYLVMLEETNFSDETVGKLQGTMRKASQKYENAQVLNIVVAYHVARLRSCLDSGQRGTSLKSISKVTGLLLLKYRSQMSRIVTKLGLFFIKTSNELLATTILVFCLNEFRQQRQALQVYTNSLFANQELLGQLGERIAARYAMLRDTQMDLTCMNLTVMRLDTAISQLLLSTISNLVESPETLYSFATLINFSKETEELFRKIFEEVFTVSYIFGLEPSANNTVDYSKLALNLCSAPMLCLMYKLAKQSSITQLPTFLNNLCLQSTVAVFTEVLTELGYASEHTSIIEAIEKDNQNLIAEQTYTKFIDYFANRGDTYERDQLRLAFFYRKLQANHVDELLSQSLEGGFEGQVVIKADLHRIYSIQKALIEHVFKVGESVVTSACRFLLTISVGDAHLSSLASLLIQKARAIKPSEDLPEEEMSTNSSTQMADELFDVLNMASKRQPPPSAKPVNPSVQIGLLLIKGLGPACSNQIKKIIGLEFDRPSDYTIQKQFMQNRLLLKLAQQGSLRNIMKSMGETLLRTENPSECLEWLFPELPQGARLAYLRYLTTKRIAGLRLDSLEWPNLLQLAQLP